LSHDGVEEFDLLFQGVAERYEVIHLFNNAVLFLEGGDYTHRQFSAIKIRLPALLNQTFDTHKFPRNGSDH